MFSNCIHEKIQKSLDALMIESIVIDKYYFNPLMHNVPKLSDTL